MTAAPKIDYLDYLQSPPWFRRRQRALERARGACNDCGSKRDLQVHHLTYERLGEELDTDLVVLCAGCHEARHPEHAKDSYLGVYLEVARDILTDNTRYESDVDLLEDMKVRCAARHVAYSSDRLKRALEIVRVDFPHTRAARPVQAFIESRWDQRITAHEARDILRRTGVAPLVERMVMPDATPASPRKADHAKALRMVFEQIEAQARKCDELENEGEK